MLNAFVGQWKLYEPTKKYSRTAVEIFSKGFKWLLPYLASFCFLEFASMTRKRGFMRDNCKKTNKNKNKREYLSLCLCPPSVSFSPFPSLCLCFASLCFCNSVALVPTLKLPFGMPRLSYTRKVWTALLKSCFGSYSGHKSRKLQKRKISTQNCIVS